MIDPVDVQQIALAAILAGAIVFFGAGYAIFYALAMLGHNRRFLRVAYGGYLCLFLSTVGLAVVLQLTGWWLILVVSLMAGYFIAPRFIWRLSVAVHDADEFEDSDTVAKASELNPSEVQPS
ncbi:MAG: hypothetical protein OES38_19110 [Gammaproteobacteria bacterium]|nr:hypothetical protein [Gammaproteobacteria bacterium]